MSASTFKFLYTKSELALLKQIKVTTDEQKEKFFDNFLDRVYNDDLVDPVEVQFTQYLNEQVYDSKNS